MTIRLSDIWSMSIEAQKHYKCHLAQSSSETGGKQPLDVFLKNKSTWQGWQEHRGKRGRWPRDFIFSLMRFYPDRNNDIWLFGGIFKVLERHPDRNYKVELTGELEGFIGRLKLRLKKEAQTTTPYLETYYDKFEVLEVLRKPYSGQPFPGYESIDLAFTHLETLVGNNRIDWQSKLENVCGVYLITDKRTGKRYVGSASGEQGFGPDGRITPPPATAGTPNSGSW